MMIKEYKLAIVIFLLTVLLGIILGSTLPAEVRIPTHWNIEGEVDGTASKTMGLVLIPVVMLLLILFFMFFPQISPRYKRSEAKFRQILPVFATVLELMFASMYLLSLMVARSTKFNGSELLWVLLGIVFVLLGTLLPKLPSSFLIGIRTPWTLSSERVWQKTHHLGGKCFVYGGILMLMAGVTSSFWGAGRYIFYGILVMIVIIPIIYSYLLYLQEK